MRERTAEKNWPTNSNLALLRFTQGNDKLKFIGHKAWRRTSLSDELQFVVELPVTLDGSMKGMPKRIGRQTLICCCCASPKVTTN
jgi:hypothetical protein